MWQVKNVYVACAFAAIGGGLFGFDISSMSVVLGTDAYLNFFGRPNATLQGAITAAMPAGSIVGTLASSFIADRSSRKAAIQIAALLWIIGSCLLSASNGIAMLISGRVVCGFGVGIASTVVPVYQAELAPREIRGRVIVLQQWAITWGILIQYFIQFGASNMDGGPDNPKQSTVAWRLPWGLQVVPALILLVGMPFLPYSPRWLAAQDRWEEAIATLARLHANGDIHHPKVLAQYREIEETLSFEKESRAAGWAALLEPLLFKRVILGISVQAWSELCGMNIMMYYIVYIMESANIASPLVTASIQYVLNCLMTVPTMLSVDRVGRRPLLLVGSLLMAVFQFTAGAIQAVYGEPLNDPTSILSWVVRSNDNASRAIIACSYLLVATFAASWGPISWAYAAEIFPNKVRAKAVSISTASNWTANCALALAVPPLLNAIGWKMWMIFGSFNAAACVHMFFTAPETKRVPLEEIDSVFVGRQPWHRRPRVTALDELTHQIADGQVKVDIPNPDIPHQHHHHPPSDEPIRVETVIELSAKPRKVEHWDDPGSGKGWHEIGRAS